MNEVTLLGNQLLFRGEDGNEKFPLSEASRFLWRIVDLHESATVRTLMEILSSDPEFYAKALMEGFLYDMVEVYKDPLFKPKKGDLDKIVFTWWSESWKHRDGDFDFHLSVDVHGSNKEHDNWAIEFVSLCEIIDAQISIKKDVEVFCYSMVPGDEAETASHKFGTQEFTLIQLLHAFVYEMTFCGSEKDKADKLEDLNIRSEEINKAIENGELEKFTSVDEMFKILRDKVDDKQNDDLDAESFKQMMGEDIDTGE